MILKGNVKRLCIYFIYDKDGIIDDYIIYQLKDMKKNVSFLHCVINGMLTVESKVKLSAVADEIFVRENKGFDVGAYQAALKHIGWDKVQKYDELIFMNYTCFGPVYPFKEAFDWAKNNDLDFWGLTMGICEMHNFPEEYAKYKFAREHIQSYFLVVRKSLLQSEDFRTFMQSRPEVKTYADSGLYFENVFTNFFRVKGYTFSTYCDCKELLKNHNYPLIIFPLQLILKQRCPVFKVKVFTESYLDLLSQSVGQQGQEVLEYLKQSKSYDVNLIWQHLLRTQDLAVIMRNCHMLRILPRDHEVTNSRENCSVGVVFHAYYTDLFDQTIEYLCGFPKNTEIFITTNTEEKKKLFDEKFSNCGYKFSSCVIENRGRDMSSLLVGARDFVYKHDLICFAHDKKTTQEKPASVGISWAYELSENMYATKEYLNNVIDLFAKEPKLGIAFPPYPTHQNYSGLGTGWVSNYEITKKLLDRFNIKSKTNPQTLCVAPLGTYFWFRTEALKKMFDIGWKYEDFPREPNRTDGTILHAIERSFAYFAQDAGYYSAMIMNDMYARIEFTNLEIQKVGSQAMCNWMRISTANAILGSSTQVENSQTAYDQKINYGIKQSLVHLAYAIRCKYPRFWGFLLPIRKLGKKILGIKTK